MRKLICVGKEKDFRELTETLQYMNKRKHMVDPNDEKVLYASDYTR